MALEALDTDREFLTKGGVFTDDMIDAYIELKEEEIVTSRHDDCTLWSSTCTTPCKASAAPKKPAIAGFAVISEGV